MHCNVLHYLVTYGDVICRGAPFLFDECGYGDLSRHPHRCRPPFVLQGPNIYSATSTLAAVCMRYSEAPPPAQRGPSLSPTDCSDCNRSSLSVRVMYIGSKPGSCPRSQARHTKKPVLRPGPVPGQCLWFYTCFDQYFRVQVDPSPTGPFC